MAQRAAGAVKFMVESPDLNNAYRQARAVGDRALAAAIRKGVRNAGAPVVAAVKAAALEQGLEQAAAATSMSFSSTSRQITATVHTNLKKAPYARALEYGSQGRRGVANRHPTFAPVGSARYQDGSSWVNQPLRPYFWRAVSQSSAQSRRQIMAALGEVFRTAGLD